MADEQDLDALRAIVAKLAGSVNALSQAHRELHGIVSEFDATVRLAHAEFERSRERMEFLNPERIESRFRTLEADQVQLEEEVTGIGRRLDGHAEALYGGEKNIGLAHGVKWLLGIAGAVLLAVLANLAITIIRGAF